MRGKSTLWGAIRLLALIFVVAPLVSWFIVKPIRIFVPEAFGLTCFEDNICVDEVSRHEEAALLVSDSQRKLADALGSFENPPKMIFCASTECAEAFGLRKRSAVTLGGFGSAFSDRAWLPHYVNHELIHQLQAHELGLVKCLLLPKWLIEGMAYALSDDPRFELEEPWQTHRRRFTEWHSGVSGPEVWEAVRGVSP